MKITFTEASWSDYLWLQENDKKLLRRIDSEHRLVYRIELPKKN
jgi:toxin YoeB